jgi:hypothetical protein
MSNGDWMSSAAGYPRLVAYRLPIDLADSRQRVENEIVDK